MMSEEIPNEIPFHTPCGLPAELCKCPDAEVIFENGFYKPNPRLKNKESRKRREALKVRTKGWGNFQRAGHPDVHTIPLEDIEEHRLDAEKCRCKPDRPDPEFQTLVRHHAFDGRELVEKAERGESIE